MESKLSALDGDTSASIFDRRILRRVSLKEGYTGEGVTEIPATIAAVVDVETTGLSLEGDTIIEFALRRIHFDGEGVVTRIEPAHVWREDPGHPIPTKITKLTGITDEDVHDQRIDEDEALMLLGGSDIVIAHFASFDKPFLSRRLPPVAEMVWGCSCVDIDWQRNGFEGRGLGWLCAQAGWFFDGHRALADVDAVITLLRHPGLQHRTLLSTLIENIRQPRVLVEAAGAEFAVKGLLKSRGYRWNERKRVWERELPEHRCLAEETWLARHVYSLDNNPRAMAPLISQVHPADRFL